MTQLNVGSAKIRLVFIGSTDVSKIYVGSSLVFSREDTKTIPNNLTTYAAIHDAVSTLGMGSQKTVYARDNQLYRINYNTSQPTNARVYYSYLTNNYITLSTSEILFYIVADDAGYLYVEGGSGSTRWIKKIQVSGRDSTTSFSVKATYNN